MRLCFKRAQVPSPEFRTFTSSPAPGYVPPFGYPAVIKPVDNMGSRGCRRVDCPADLETALPEAFRFSRSGRVILEEFMEGLEFSVDAIVYRGEITICGLADRHIFFSPYFIEMGHTMPADLPGDTVREILAVFERGVRALGIDDGAAKGDVKLTPRGPMIGEIAARLSGGYMSGWTYPYSSGVEVTRGAILVAMGEAPGDLAPRRSWTSAERAFISIPGIVRSIEGIGEARAVPGVKDIFFRAERGGRVRFPENNVTKCGNIISAAADRAGAIAAAEEGVRSILIRLEAPDPETDRFLASTSGGYPRFPPPAFTIPASIATLLEKLPETTLPPVPLETGGEEAPVSLIPFQEFTGRTFQDYVGRTVEESLRAVRKLTGLSLPAADSPEAGQGIVLGRSFWKALVRGGYQGAVYLIDLLRAASGRVPP
jgi:biotin carboxylase